MKPTILFAVFLKVSVTKKQYFLHHKNSEAFIAVAQGEHEAGMRCKLHTNTHTQRERERERERERSGRPSGMQW